MGTRPVTHPARPGPPPDAIAARQRFAHPDTPNDAAQLAVRVLANAVRPRTVASTTGKPASAARRRNFRRSSSFTLSVDESGL